MATPAALQQHAGAAFRPPRVIPPLSARCAGTFGSRPCSEHRAFAAGGGRCKSSPGVLICAALCPRACGRRYGFAWHSFGRANRPPSRESDIRSSLGFQRWKFERVGPRRRSRESAIDGGCPWGLSEESSARACASSSGAEFGTRDVGNWQNAVAVVGRALALSCAAACVAWLLCPGRGLTAAVEGAGAGGSALVAPGPSVKKILGVFKDQGLLLSVLLGLSAFFSMAETSIMTLWPWKVRELAEKEGEGGVFRLLSKDVTRFLTTILIGTTVVNIAATALVTDAATSLFGEAGVTAATGVMTVVILIVTEITPKSIAVHNAAKVARIAVRPVAFLSMVLYPVGRVVTAISMALLKFLGLKSTGDSSVSEVELKLMLRGAELSGAIEEEEQDMIENVLEIKDTFVREVMTPLVDVVAIDAQSTLIEFRNHWMKHQYSRMPVFERRVDNIVGIAYAMDLLEYIDYDAEQLQALKSLTVECIAHKPAYFVPDSMSVWNLLREFRVRKVHMAIVLNEYGGAIGVVTLEDVVEEIVGEIFDENDSKEEIRKKTGYVVQRANGVFDVDANTHIEDLSEALEVQMPEGPYRYETVSGFVCEAFGYIPRTGESIDVALKKAESDGDQERGEDHHEDQNKGKFQKFKLEILAGNARKVGAVRFQVDKSLTKEDGFAFAQNTEVFGKVWAGPAGATERSLTASDDDDEFCDAEYMEGAPECQDSNGHQNGQPHSSSNGQLFIAEAADRQSEDSRNGNQVIDSDDWELISSEPVGADRRGEEDDEGNGNVPPRRQTEVQEGRSARRRGSPAALDLDRKYRINLRRQEVESARAAMSQEIQHQSHSEKIYESST